MEITSVNNELVKEYAKLKQTKYRNQTNKFLIEGYKAVKEAFDYGIELENVFVKKEKTSQYEFCQKLLVKTNEAVLKKLSTTDSAPESVAIGIQKKYDLSVLKKLNKIILLEDIKDAGNLGTIIRSSVAFNTDAIILYKDSVDVYNPKCVRSAVGNLWKIPIFHIGNLKELQKYIDSHSRIATLPKSKNLLKNTTIKTPVVIMFGSEAEGLSNELIDYATNDIKIEMNKNVESLNLATSVSILEYQIFS